VIYVEDNNNTKLRKLLPDLQKMANALKIADEAYDKRKKEIAKEFKVKITTDPEGYYIVQIGRNSGTFDYTDSANDEIDEIDDAKIKNRILAAGKATQQNYNTWRENIHTILQKLGWAIWEEDECAFEIEKNGIILEIGGAMHDYKRYIVCSPTTNVTVGHVLEYAIEHMERKKKEASK
jgi:hypothetical protein